MLVSDFLTRVNYALRGIDDDTPIFSSDEANYWIETLNRKKDELYQDVSKLWSNTYETRSLTPTVSISAAPSFNLPADFLAPSNDVYVVTTDSQRINYDIIKPEERDYRYHTRQAFIAGQNPQVIYFTTPVVTGENAIGGTVYVPGYYLPADVEEDDDVLPFLDPNWAVMAVASEIAFNDIVYEDKAADLNEKANALYRAMASKNRRGTYKNPRTVPRGANPIRRVGWRR